VIPTRDRAQLLAAALESLATQTLPPEQWEVVVVDDGSADDTADVSRALARRLPLVYHRIAPSGISAAKNLGAFASSAPIVLFFDDDDVADADLLRQHVLTHEAHPDPAVAVLGKTSWAPWVPVNEVMRYVTDVGKFLFDYSFIHHGEVLDHTFFWGGRASCKRMFLAAEGIFDPTFTFGSEDIELAYRLARRGFKVVYNADAQSYMNRPLTFEQFCRRCERQGRSQHRFGNVLHGDDPEVRRYCDVDGAAERWAEVAHDVDGWRARVAELEALLDGDGARSGQNELRAELHRLYGDTFRALKLKGLVAAMDEEGTAA
jgi:cellulose synthase/poly-beta-1,6-N-acetylglucosamine synthase-like glycosyltransferase